MNTREFQEQLRKTGAYETVPGESFSLADRMFGWSDAWYYFILFRIVVAASALARQGKYCGEALSESSWQTLSAVERCGGRVSITGMKHIAELKQPRVYIANHMSMLETFLLPAMLLAFGDSALIIKESLLGYPLFGVVLRALKPIVVTRKNPKEDLKRVLTEGKESLRAGRSVCVFPQATRSAGFDPESFNTLGVKLAGRAGVPAIPVAVKTDFHGIGRIFRDFGPIDRSKTVRFRFGAPLKVEKGGKVAHEKTVRFVADNLLEWGCEVSGNREEQSTQGEML